MVVPMVPEVRPEASVRAVPSVLAALSRVEPSGPRWGERPAMPQFSVARAATPLLALVARAAAVKSLSPR